MSNEHLTADDEFIKRLRTRAMNTPSGFGMTNAAAEAQWDDYKLTAISDRRKLLDYYDKQAAKIAELEEKYETVKADRDLALKVIARERIGRIAAEDKLASHETDESRVEAAKAVREWKQSREWRSAIACAGVALEVMREHADTILAALSQPRASTETGAQRLPCPECDGFSVGVTRDGIEMDCSKCNGMGAAKPTRDVASFPALPISEADEAIVDDAANAALSKAGRRPIPPEGDVDAEAIAKHVAVNFPDMWEDEDEFRVLLEEMIESAITANRTQSNTGGSQS